MLTDFNLWLGEIVCSFDGSDIFAFLAGILFMLLYKNIRVLWWNRHHPRSIKVNLPKLNRKWLTNGFIALVMLLVLASSYETNQAVRDNAHETKAIAVRTCEDSKVSSIERNGLQTLLLGVMNPPANIKSLPTNDPVRQEFGRKLALDYLGVLEVAGQQRRSIRDGGHVPDEVWNKYMGPQPPPRCG